MHEYKFHIIYKTTNLINGKIYVGLHSTDNVDDNYLGSGWILKSAIKKYGRENFKREVLLVLSNREEAREVESLLVDKEFVSRQDCAEALGFARGNIRNLLYKGIRGRRGRKISYC